MICEKFTKISKNRVKSQFSQSAKTGHFCTKSTKKAPKINKNQLIKPLSVFFLKSIKFPKVPKNFYLKRAKFQLQGTKITQNCPKG